MLPSYITIHCTATKNGKKLPIETIREWHMARGFSDVGYHVVIQPDGTRELGRPLNISGAHVKGYNVINRRINLGIALVGDDSFSDLQFASLRDEIVGLRLLYPIKEWDIFGHYEFSTAREQGKTCPNMDIKRVLYWLWNHDENAIKPYLLDPTKFVIE